MNKLYLLIVILFVHYSCTQSKKQEGESKEDTTSVVITLTKAPPSPAYEDASLTLDGPTDPQLSTDSITFEFSVSNYELGVQTSDAATRGIANSEKGQHIHLIINNGPYSAHYEPMAKKMLPEGEYVVLAFLSRSYHESVKNEQSYVVASYTVGSPQGEGMNFDPDGQHLFYSRPKGTYSGSDTEKLLLDFFLLNTEIAPDGNKVKATINNQEFIIDEWVPYYIEGLGKGDVSIKLELIDNGGNPIPGPFNVVERIVTLE